MTAITTAIALTLASPALASEDKPESNVTFVARPVAGHEVIPMLYHLAPGGRHTGDYVEISEAIANASTQDPLFPSREDGAVRTACILVALAFLESNFHRSVVGDNGRSFGLYQIQPPTAKVEVKMLTVPRDASFVAIDLIRQSFMHAARKGKPWHQGLAWYAASSDAGSRLPGVVRKSTERMALAEKLYKRFFPGTSSSPPALKTVNT